jgi:simple sugar transport system ATP-binding protein
MTSTNVLEMEGIYKSFPGVVANDHIDFTVEDGEIHGLLGENGAGKSTLMKILFGLYTADDGTIRYRGELLDIDSPQDAIDAGLGMVHQHFQLLPKLTVAENVVLGLREPFAATTNGAGSEGMVSKLFETGPLKKLSRLLSYDEQIANERVSEVASEFGIDIDPTKKVGELEVGEQQRVEILKALYRDVDLLVLDEPTAVLTPNQIDRLFETLRGLVDRGLTVVIITHKLGEVIEITDRVTVLREGKSVSTVETSSVTESDLAHMMVGREVLRDIDRRPVEKGGTVLELSNVQAENDRGIEQLAGIDLTIREGEVLGLAGVSGNGQSALTDCLVGKRPTTAGSIRLDGTDITDLSTSRRVENGLSYVPADRYEDGSAPALTLVHNSVVKDYRSPRFRKWPLGIGMDYDSAQRYAESLVEEYDVRVPNVDVSAGALSGGNLQKLILGRELNRDPSLLIAEQPTRGLDVGAIEEVRNKILEQRVAGTGVLLISEKLDEIMELSDRIAVIYNGEIVHEESTESADRGEIGLYMNSGSLDKSDQVATTTST